MPRYSAIVKARTSSQHVTRIWMGDTIRRYSSFLGCVNSGERSAVLGEVLDWALAEEWRVLSVTTDQEHTYLFLESHDLEESIPIQMGIKRRRLGLGAGGTDRSHA